MSQQCGVGDFYIKNKGEITMKITLKDGSSKEYSEAKSVYEISKDISEGLARVACAGEVDGEIVDLRTVLDKDCTLNIITASDEEGLRVIRHTASHVLAQAVKNLFPDAKITIGPAIDDGFYYDFDSQPFSREDLDALEAEMKKIIKQGHEITRFTLPREEAIKFMKEKDEPYKVELIEELPEGEEISFYDQGGFVDLCAGPHLMSTKGVKAFKLTASSMAYWRGDSNKARLHRIYGTAYNKKEDLKAHLERMEEREFVGEQRRKKTYKEKCEFERLEKEIAELEKEQKQIEEELCSGTLSIEQLTEKSKRLPIIKESLEEKEMRWLELSEID
jgi:threonyl-tRNA synthetase